MAKKVSAPSSAPADVAPKSTVVYLVTDKGLASAGRSSLITLQRSAKGFGKAWRANGKHDNSLRAAALNALIDASSDESGAIGQDAALAALKAINLGSKTPASRLSAFVRAGLLTIQS